MERTKIKFTAYSSNKVVQKTPRNGLRASEKICQAEVVYSFKKVQYVQQPPRMILNNLRELRRIEAGLGSDCPLPGKPPAARPAQRAEFAVNVAALVVLVDRLSQAS